MGTWDRLIRAGRKLWGGAGRAADATDSETRGEASLQGSPSAPQSGGPGRGLSSWVENRAKRVVEDVYETHAEDLQQRALHVMNTAYERSADDMEERAVRAMRRAIEAEAERIKEAIEHGIAVKRREVRLSLLVLVVSSLVYLALYWLTRRPGAP